MLRTDFLLRAGGSLSVFSSKVWADHQLFSLNPLIVDFKLASLPGQYTPESAFYVRNHYPTPQQTSAFLEISGKVEKPQTLTLNGLTGLSQQTFGAVLECAGDAVVAVGLVTDGLRKGWRLAEVISMPRPMSGAGYVHLVGRDSFSPSVPLARIMNYGYNVWDCVPCIVD
jgi:DMSO/TMAO reductase YedYZ molybdopterin-dependent catalytic subunit